MNDVAEDITFRAVWRHDDPAIVEDVKRLWAAQGVPTTLTAQRQNDICAVAYCDGVLAGVSTAEIFYFPNLRNKFFMYRCMVNPRFRQKDLAWRISAFSFDVLQTWARQNSSERILGLLINVETDKFQTGLRRPVREKYGFVMHFVGYTAAGQQLRAVWFDHAELDDFVVAR